MDGAPAATGLRPDYPHELAAAEDALVRARREAVRRLDAPPGDPPTFNELSSKVAALGDRVGVGLSGGGIRSATFALGVFQALARAEHPDGTRARLVQQIDYLSTVSGGGYFGSFFGRLFTRPWIGGPRDVERVLRGEPEPALGGKALRFLRDNGRYLAPRGSGDVLMMLAVALRNWMAVQVALITLALAIFTGLQAATLSLPLPWVTAVQAAIEAIVPGTLWWSWWLAAIVPVVLLWTMPTGWAYWVIGQPLARRNVLRRTDLIVLAVCGAAAFAGDPSARAQIAIAVIATAAAATSVWAFVAGRLGASTPPGEGERKVYRSNLAHNRLSAWFKYAVMAAVAVFVLALIDSLGASLYVLVAVTGVSGALGAAVALFAGMSAFGRQVLILSSRFAKGPRPGALSSVVSWILALVLLTGWLVVVNTASHAVAWMFRTPEGYPAALTQEAPPRLVDADAVVIQPDAGGGQIVRPEVAPPQPPPAPAPPRNERRTFALMALIVFAALVLAVGHSPTFLNLSTLHAFYAQRLTRAYLGASNRGRLDARSSLVTEVMHGDDLPADEYWRWPRAAHKHSPWEVFTAIFSGEAPGSAAPATAAAPAAAAATADQPVPEPRGDDSVPSGSVPPAIGKGGPLHLVNVTVNETLDARTGVQQQDRKGVGLAIGPAGFSLGVRHHLVADERRGSIAPGDGGHHVFNKFVSDPELLTLGRWISISGAAFTPAAGARTSVPLAILTTFANVRLGYWWDSGLMRPLLQTLLPPVHRGLIAECFARIHGTADRQWNLSDGGHFENLAGYELIRRRLPLIILVDAEADADYTFEGLANLVRKARLDFGAEVEFLGDAQLRTVPIGDHGDFGPLDTLRRGRWSDEPVDDPTVTPPRKRLSVETNRTFYSRAHAALATVTYSDGTRSWLVYVKASLTGDEPADVLQYHRGHVDFPQETTADQFFDEAQWESYRRLGEHIGARVLTPAVFALSQDAPAPGR